MTDALRNPRDCHCEYIHCSDPTCRSKKISHGAVKESERFYPANQAIDWQEKARRFLSYYSTELGEDKELVSSLANLLQGEHE